VSVSCTFHSTTIPNLCVFSLDVILRGSTVEGAKAGDKCIFTGYVAAIPDVAALGLPGMNAEMMRESSGGRSNAGIGAMGVGGLKSLGVRELNYKMAFLACMVQSADAQVTRMPFSIEIVC
jgi:DNA replication licensing factor MCM6